MVGLKESKEILDDWLRSLSDQSHDCLQTLSNSENQTKTTNDEPHDDTVETDFQVESVELVDVEQWWSSDSEKYKNKRSGNITLVNGDVFKGWFSEDYQNRIGVHIHWSGGSDLKTSGEWVSGRLEGLTWVDNQYGGYEETIFESGVKHGPSRSFGPCPKRSDNLWLVCLYERGRMSGQFWRGSLGGGYITGIAENNEITGDNLAYIFPNLTDAVVGRFNKGKLVTGENVHISSVKLIHGIAVPEFTNPEKKTFLTRDISTAYQISSTPLQPDNLEHARVEVKQSNNDGAGEGLFAKTQFTSGDLVSILNGTRVVPSLQEDWSDYKVHFSSELDLDIPDDMRSLDQYCATLAHKANHSFTPNTKWGRMEHPRYGFVVTLLALRSITVGEEITVNYNYNSAIAPAWYKQCLAEFKNIQLAA